MKVKELLLKFDIDISTNKSVLANQLKADLARDNYRLDFGEMVEELTPDDIYQIGKSLILPENKGKGYSKVELYRIMNERIEKSIK